MARNVEPFPQASASQRLAAHQAFPAEQELAGQKSTPQWCRCKRERQKNGRCMRLPRVELTICSKARATTTAIEMRPTQSEHLASCERRGESRYIAGIAMQVCRTTDCRVVASER